MMADRARTSGDIPISSFENLGLKSADQETRKAIVDRESSRRKPCIEKRNIQVKKIFEDLSRQKVNLRARTFFDTSV